MRYTGWRFAIEMSTPSVVVSSMKDGACRPRGGLLADGLDRVGRAQIIGGLRRRRKRESRSEAARMIVGSHMMVEIGDGVLATWCLNFGRGVDAILIGNAG